MEETIRKEIDFIIDNFKSINKNKIDLAIIAIAVILGIFLGWRNMEIIIFTVFIASILRPLASRYLAIPALFFLVFTPFLLILNRGERAEEFAIYAYYFLVLAVIMGIYEIWKEEYKDKVES